MNDPLGLFEEDSVTNDPLGLFEEDNDLLAASKKQAMEYSKGMAGGLGGLGQAGLGMLVGAPSYVAGGLRGASSILAGEGVDKAVQRMEETQKSNFGFGAFKPWTKQGEESTKQLEKIMTLPKEALGSAGEYIAGNEGRYVGELVGDTLANFVSPAATIASARAGMKKFKSKPDAVPADVAKTKVDKMLAEQEAKTPAEPAPTVEPSIKDTRTGDQLSKEAYDAALREKQLQRESAFNRPDQFPDMVQESPMDRMVRDLGGKPESFIENDGSALGRMADDVTAERGPKQLDLELAPKVEPPFELARPEGVAPPMPPREVVKTRLDNPMLLETTPDGGLGEVRAAEPQTLARTTRETASDKVANGQQFAMTAEERVYWEKTRKVIQEVSDGVKTLTNKEILNKIKDRKWVQETIDKITQRQEMFKEIEQRSRDQAAVRTAEKKRELLEEQLIALQEHLSPPRPDTSRAQQGPKTRAAKREANPFGDGIIELNSGLKPNWDKLFPKAKIENTLALSEDNTYIPNNPNTKVAIEKALEQGKDGKQWNMVQSGSTSVAMKTGSPIVKAASEIVQNGLKRADLLIRNSVFPAEQALKKLSKQDIVDLGEVFKAEMTNGKRFDSDVLTRNLSVKQLQAYTDMRRLFDDALDSMNAARLAKGLDPVKPMEAYMASRWQGDFRRPIYNADGKLVWYLASNSKLGLESQTKALKEKFPDLVVDPKKDHTVRSSHSKTELESMYTKMLDILGRDDPAVQKIEKAMQEQAIVQGEGMLGQQKHFESKAGIRGFVGDRPGANPRTESIAMFQQQIQYAKNAYRWSEMQKAADDIKTIVSDPRLQEQQPNNVKYIREYFKNAVGMGEGKGARLLDDSLRDSLGVSPTLLNKAVGDVKSFFILQKLAASAGYTMANLVQTSNVLPYLSQMAGAGYRGNPVGAVLNGTLQGMAMVTWHHARNLGAGADLPLPNQFMRDAFNYAEDNGVIARSVYDESPISANFGIVGGAANIAAKTMTIPESFVRSVAFMTYANMLKSSGKFADESKLFQMAEEYVNKSMVDYRETERPLAFSKMGAVGNFANTLQTYPISFYNQYAYMAKQAIEGNPWGLGAMLATHYAVAGAMGIPGFEDVDKLYKWLRDNALPTDKWAEVMKSPFMSDPKLWLMENAGNAAVYGMLSDKSGIGLTSRVAAPGAGAMLQSPAGPITDIAGQVANVAKLAVDPSNKEKQAQVAISSLPVGLQGLLETADFMKDYTYVTRPDGTKVFMKTKDIADRKGGYARTPEEVTMRKFGLRSQKEVVERDVSYATTSALQTATKKSGELIDRYYSAIRRGDTKKAQELNKVYIDLTGKEIQDRDMENQIKEEFMTDVERSKSAIETVRKAQAIARMNKLLGK